MTKLIFQGESHDLTDQSEPSKCTMTICDGDTIRHCSRDAIEDGRCKQHSDRIQVEILAGEKLPADYYEIYGLAERSLKGEYQKRSKVDAINDVIYNPVRGLLMKYLAEIRQRQLCIDKKPTS